MKLSDGIVSWGTPFILIIIFVSVIIVVVCIVIRIGCNLNPLNPFLGELTSIHITGYMVAAFQHQIAQIDISVFS